MQSSPEQLRSALKEHGVTQDIGVILAELYDQHRETLIQHMLLTGTNKTVTFAQFFFVIFNVFHYLGIAAPTIVDIDWRIDYTVRSKQGGRENKPLFFVSLKVKDRGIITSIDMIASEAELQDMLNKVKDAVKQVERILNTSS